MVTSQTRSPRSTGRLAIVATSIALTVPLVVGPSVGATELVKPGTDTTTVTGAPAVEQIFTSGTDAIDGRTFSDRKRNQYRIVDIRTPGEDDICKDAEGTVYDCAARARVMLRTMAGGFVTCLPAGAPDADGTLPVRCTDMADRDIGRMMVAAGWALPEAANIDYAFDAMEAQARRKGLWQGRFRIKRR